MTISIRSLILLALSILPLAGLAAELTSTVDRTKISIDETFTLTVRYSGSAQGEPDFTLLEKQFEILSRGHSTNFRSINGAFTSSTEWTLSLAPRMEGRLVIPSFTFDRLISDAITITVTPPQQAPAGELKDIFVETLISKDQSYVQEQILMTYRLYYSVNIDGKIGEDLKLDDAIVVDLEDTTYQRYVDGKLYRVTEFNFALFPQASGNLTIPSLNWTFNVANYRIGRIEKKRVRTEQKVVMVKPQPANFPAGATWLPADNLEIYESWSKDPEKFKIGEPITRTLTLKATGLISSQLPAFIPDESTKDLKFYPDKPNRTDTNNKDGVYSERIESAAVVVNNAGDITIPGLSIPWWDVKADTLRFASIPERTISVAGGGARTSATNATSPSTANIETQSTPVSDGQTPIATLNAINYRMWQAATVVFALLAGLFALLWWQAKNKYRNLNAANPPETRSHNEKQTFNQLKSACRDNNLPAIRKHLIDWAQLHWPMVKILALADIARQVDDQQLQNQILALDSALYGNAGHSGWNGELLLTALSTWMKAGSKSQHDSQQHLVGLYPSSV